MMPICWLAWTSRRFTRRQVVLSHMMDRWQSLHALRQPHGSWWTSLCISRACRWVTPANKLKPKLSKFTRVLSVWAEDCLSENCCFSCQACQPSREAFTLKLSQLLSCLILHYGPVCGSKCLAHISMIHWTTSSQWLLFSAFISDAFPAAAEPEPAISDLPQHERQCSPSPATEQPLHPHQYQLQHAGQRLSQQQGSEAPISRYKQPPPALLQLISVYLDSNNACSGSTASKQPSSQLIRWPAKMENNLTSISEPAVTKYLVTNCR